MTDPLREKFITRSGLLRRLGGGLAAVLAAGWFGRREVQPRDIELHEADFYSPHDLAG